MSTRKSTHKQEIITVQISSIALRGSLRWPHRKDTYAHDRSNRKANENRVFNHGSLLRNLRTHRSFSYFQAFWFEVVYNNSDRWTTVWSSGMTWLLIAYVMCVPFLTWGTRTLKKKKGEGGDPHLIILIKHWFTLKWFHDLTILKSSTITSTSTSTTTFVVITCSPYSSLSFFFGLLYHHHHHHRPFFF